MRLRSLLADDLPDLELAQLADEPRSERSSPMASAVRLAAAVLNVMYRVTFSAPKYGVSCGRR